MSGAERLVRLSLLDGYQVRWNAQTVARDVIQNFYDEVADFRAVEVTVRGGTITVRGPSVFELDYLRYIGATTKDAPERRSAGGFGEGFKICALVLLRDFGVTLEAGAGNWVIRPELVPMKLGRELCYRVTDLPAQAAGSFVRIQGASRALRNAFATGKELFLHADNPRLAKPIHVDREAGVGVYESPDSHRGDLFYRRQHRGTLAFRRGGALTFSLETRLDVLEGHRDRRDLRAAGPMVAQIARQLPDAVLRDVCLRLRRDWQSGGRVLTVLVRAAASRGIQLTFSRRWLARSQKHFRLNTHAENRGFHLGAVTLAAVGMPTVDARFGRLEQAREGTPVEQARMHVVADVYTALGGAPPPYKSFKVRDVPEGMNSVQWDGRACEVDATWLAAPFLDGLVPALGALARKAGVAARNNGDRLTALIRGALRHTGALEAWARRWEDAARDPAAELATPRFVPAEDSLSVLANTVWLYILAPPGFPPAEAFRDRAIALGDTLGLRVRPIWEAVCNELDALDHGARGVPTYALGRTELEAVRGARVGYRLRPWADAEGLAPSDEAVRAVLAPLAAQVAAGKQLHLGGRLRGNKAAALRWLARHEPHRHCVRVTQAALSKQLAGIYGQFPHALAAAISQGAHRRAREAQPELAEVDGWCRKVVDEVTAEMVDLAKDLREALRHLPAEEQEDVLSGLLDHAESYGGGHRPPEQIRALAGPVGVLAAAAAAAPLDNNCRLACLHHVRVTLLAAPDPTAPEALAAALRELDEVTALAVERHAQRDESGEPPSCYSFGSEVLNPLRPAAPVKVAQAGAEAAVRAAWEHALAGGCSRQEAAARALETARQFPADEA
ncbi:MAG: hypothetical protein HY904_19935 [Deltaproteobacteria bacterium]|nr:hypothetical protein [Deltaproteobacteria bacterium]